MNGILFGKRVFAKVITGLEVKRSSWNIQMGADCHHSGQYKGGAERDVKHSDEEHVKM